MLQVLTFTCVISNLLEISEAYDDVTALHVMEAERYGTEDGTIRRFDFTCKRKPTMTNGGAEFWSSHRTLRFLSKTLRSPCNDSVYA